MKDTTPQLIADVTLYATDRGGRRSPNVGEWFGCPCKFDEKDFSAWDGRILLNGEPMQPGQTKRLGIMFLSPEIAPAFRSVRKFYLWEGRIIGEAVSVSN